MASEDPKLEDYRLMSEQTHPQILASNVEYLSQIANRAQGQMQLIEQHHSTRRKDFAMTIGITALVTTVAEIHYNVLKEVAHLQGSWDKYIIGAGLAMAGIKSVRWWMHDSDARDIERAAREEHQTLENFHQIAKTRAEEMQLPGFTEGDVV